MLHVLQWRATRAVSAVVCATVSQNPCSRQLPYMRPWPLWWACRCGCSVVVIAILVAGHRHTTSAHSWRRMHTSNCARAVTITALRSLASMCVMYSWTFRSWAACRLHNRIYDLIKAPRSVTTRRASAYWDGPPTHGHRRVVGHQMRSIRSRAVQNVYAGSIVCYVSTGGQLTYFK